jgi:hypothetical protein
MVRTSWMLILAVAVLSVVLVAPAGVKADWVVAAPPAVSYYYPAPTVTYYSPPVVSYYTPPVIYPTAPAVSYYYGSAVSYYRRPVYPVTSVGVTTYYGPLGRPRVISTYPPVYIAR